MHPSPITPNPVELSEDAYDALKEMLNLGLGDSSQIISELIDGAYVSLSIPTAEIVSVDELSKYTDISAVGLSFEGSAKGTALLILDKESSDNIVKAMTQDIDQTGGTDALTEEVLQEVGNIVVSNVMGAIVNNLGYELDYSLPNYINGSLSELMSKGMIHSTDVITIASTDFEIESIKATAKFWLVFDRDTFDEFVNSTMKFFGLC